jgi:putative transposase
MLRWQGYKFELLRPTGEQVRNMRRFAGARRFVFNKALALNNEMQALIGKKHSQYQMDQLIPAWKEEFPWLFRSALANTPTSLKGFVPRLHKLQRGASKIPDFRKEGQEGFFPLSPRLPGR